MAGLTEDQIAFYKAEGYLLLDECLPVEAYQPLVDEFHAAIERRAREAQARGQLEDLFEDAPFDQRLALLCAAMGTDKRFVGEILGKDHKTAGLFYLLTHPAILNVVESIIGPEILVHPQFNVRAKMPGEAEVAWHQDIAFLDPEVEDTFMINFWVPLVPTNVKNGCLEILAGSHKCGMIPHQKVASELEIPEAQLPPAPRVLSVLPAGGAALIQHKTVHRSFPNQSDHIRWSLDIRYSDYRLPTGRDQVPGFVAKSAIAPDRVAKGHEDWLRLMDEAGHPSS